MTTTIALVRDLYAAFAARDVAALDGLLAADVEWIQCPGFPGGAHRTSSSDVIEGVLGGLNTTWDDFAVDVDELLDAGSHAVAIGAYRGRHRETGRAMRSVFTHVYESDGERIVRFRQFADTWPMVAAMGGAPPVRDN